MQDDVIGNKKKIQTLKGFLETSHKKILILLGPPGSGKNSVIEAFAKENDI